jgi:hypothetical protein
MFTRALCTVLLLTCVTAGAVNAIRNAGSVCGEVGSRRPLGDWWDDDWPYRSRIFIDNQHNNEVLVQFPVPVEVPYRGGMKPDFSDIRFTDVYGSLLLPHWIEEFERSSSARVWVRVPEIPAATNVYIYYGNPDAPSQSDIDGYAELCEPFVDDPTRSGDWSVYRHAGEDSLEGCWDPSEEVLYLTRGEGGLGVAAFTDVDLSRLGGWVLTFDYLAGGGTGGEGFCAMFFKDEAPYVGGSPSCGNGLGFTTADGRPIRGFGVEFDAHAGGGDPNMPHVALIEDHADNHLLQIGDDRVGDGAWHDVELIFHQGRACLSLDAGALFTYFFGDSGGGFSYGGLGFSAATGGLTNDHVIDNVLVRKWTNPMPTSMVGEEEGLTQTVVETSFGYVKALYR